MNIMYIKGDATSPIAPNNKVITHICNDIGGWGKGFVLALSKKWKIAEEAYRQWYRSQEDFSLGVVQFVKVADDIYVANMIGQQGIYKNNKGLPPIRYEAVRQCLKEVALFATKHAASVHMPRIGCGLAGGKWELIEEIIKEELIAKGIAVTVYDL
ncbi:MULTISPECIES: macro domain-containing protein [Bacteroides]|uniref:Appr-1-p processing protein n=1 Tax=Bacteroides acidifaciens TaxID=85831 RepID=A0A4S2A8K4_9BACE|nr:macro domain-containing protein [Bacteroides acidifaciens]TGX96283.1 Appr-1-p processing protein [Bacteroides acidifaciens]